MPPLAEVLDLAKAGPGRYRGGSPVPVGRVFGGQLVGQSVMAAGGGLGEEWAPQSVHAHFLHPGDPVRPLDYRVEDVRGGIRRVVASQGQDLCVVVVTFGPSLSDAAMEPPTSPAAIRAAAVRGTDGRATHGRDVGGPAGARSLVVPDERAALAGVDARTEKWLDGLGRTLPLEVRFLERPARDAVLRGERPGPWQRILVRPAGELPDDPLAHTAALAYLSDLFLLSTALLPHGLLMGGPDLLAVSLDHAVWFRGAIRMDDWRLYTMDSPWAGDGRALCRGEISDLEGRLLASTAQEGLLRSVSDSA